MKKYLFFALFLLFVCLAGNALGLEVPQLKGRVNDYAAMLNSKQIKQLEKKLEEHETSTSNQVVVLTIPTLGEDNLEEFSIRVAEKWKIGQAQKDNGVILLIVKNDRKMRIEVGMGLEGALPDIVCGRIINEILKPAFKAENYFSGINDGIDTIFLAIKGEFKADSKISSKGAGDFIIVVFWIIAIIIIILVARSKGGGGGSFRGGRGFGSSFGRGSGGSSSGGGFSGGGGRSGGGGASGSW